MCSIKNCVISSISDRDLLIKIKAYINNDKPCDEVIELIDRYTVLKEDFENLKILSGYSDKESYYKFSSVYWKRGVKYKEMSNEYLKNALRYTNNGDPRRKMLLKEINRRKRAGV